MSDRWNRWLLVAAGAVLLVTAWGGARAEAVLLAEEVRGAVEPQGERRLVIKGVIGQIGVTKAEDGRLRFASNSLPAGGVEPAMSLWSEGGGLVLRAPEGEEATPRTLWVALPDGISLRTELSDSKVTVADLAEPIEIDGRDLEVEVVRARADVTLTLEGGDASVNGLEGGLTLSVVGADVRVQRSASPVSADLRESTVRIEGVSGILDIDSEQGSLEIREGRGGDVRLSETALTLAESNGAWRIETDAAVTLEETDADLMLESWGGRVEGSLFEGPLTLRVHNATAVLSALSAGAVIEADGSDVRLSTVKGELRIVSRSSSLGVVGAGDAVFVEADGGSLRLTDSAGPVEVDSEGTEVTIEGAAASLNIAADALNVDVEWKKLSTGDDSEIVNEGGDVTIRLPASGGCRLNARSRRGWIEADHPDVRISDDREHASGVIRRRRNPTLKVEAEGAITVLWP
jgi:hypothetical protein